MFSLFRKNKRQKSMERVFDKYLSEDKSENETVVLAKVKRQIQYILVFARQNASFDETRGWLLSKDS